MQTIEPAERPSPVRKHSRAIAFIGLIVLGLAGPVTASAQEAAPPVENPQAATLDSRAPEIPAAVAPATGEETRASRPVPHNLSPWGMFLAADIVVKAVMLGLAFASLVTWTIWLAKGLEIWSGKRRVRRAVNLLRRADGLAQARQHMAASLGREPAAALVEAAHDETVRSEKLPPEGIKERTAMALSRIEARAGRQMSRGTGVLATIGATAPFVGLFGTVWGIMNAFIGISRSQTTNLAVVAPGIAEALLATAIGLVAAIPAVVIYNVFARAIADYRSLLSDASAEVMRHLSRDLDRRATKGAPVVSLHAAGTPRARRAE